MFNFFSKITQKMGIDPMITLGEIAILGFFVPPKLLKVKREKERIEQANPGKKIVMKPIPGWLGFKKLSWAVEETAIPPLNDREKNSRPK